MMAMQKELWEKYQDRWSPMEPLYARNSILWMIEELGEVIAIIKKREETAIMNDLQVRSAFVEEFADVLMYLTDALLRYRITPDELSAAYIEKHRINMTRDFDQEHSNYLNDK